MERFYYKGGRKVMEERIDAYFRRLEEAGERGGPSDLLAAIGLDSDTARRLAAGDGAYGAVLREAATRLRAHLETSPAWAGSNGSKAVFLLKQQLWDGLTYADKRESGGGCAAVQVRFGPDKEAGDAFG